MGFVVGSFLASATDCAAQADFTWNYESNKLGAADRFGFASWSAPLASLTLQGFTIPLKASFTSDTRPALTPSPLGRGWFIPFFGSALIEEGQTTLRWLRPDGRVIYYSKQRGNSLGKTPGTDAPVEFTSREGGWRAVKVGKKRVYRLTHQGSGVELVYEDARLVRFCLARPGEGVDSYTISYNRLFRPARLSTFGSGRVVAEFSYDDASRAKELSLGDAKGEEATKIAFAYVDSALNQFPSGPYLSRMGNADAQTPDTNAVRQPSTLTPLSITYQSEGTTANRIRFEKLTAGAGNAGLLWDAKSGFIREDDSAVYEIENPSLANAGRPSLSPSEAKPAGDIKKTTEVADYNWRPDEAKITRTDREGKSEFRFNDRSKGILTTKDKNGVTTLTHYLLTPGPMMNKVRKVETLSGNKLISIERNAYDETGRILRKIHPNGDIELWEYGELGGYIKSINGQLSKSEEYDINGIRKRIYLAPGGLAEDRITWDGKLKTTSSYLNGKFRYARISDESGRIIKTIRSE
jgi:hypothetical protein